jgi:hypothetical protein
MFDFFRKREYTTAPPMPFYEHPKEKEPMCAYNLGATTENTHMMLTVGYTTVTMTKQGCQNLIDQLEVFKNTLDDLDD